MALKMEGLPWLLEAGQGESTLSLSLQEESALLTSGFDLCPQVPERKSVVQSHWVWRFVTAPDADTGIFQRPQLGVLGHLTWAPAE